ncbi:SGNH/GDSL hydrolase family protein [Rhizobium lusitanum]|uniref:SGNH/GDSL hydrolase family protein n=1 Tax=Rhizobium lusitanum TaxID=293958 RepID=A0A7X0IV82_9HYPH|nr:SGNH/GDSL hydrolase family protein [Rhizobium lusitanum]MBB6487744.1 hypothetical protein [Rhizobium lusitanum]
MAEEEFQQQQLNDRIESDIAQRTLVHQANVARIASASDAAKTLARTAPLARPLIMLANGDSWYDYPLTGNGLPLQDTDIIAQLRHYGTVPPTVLNLAHRGDAAVDEMSLPKQERMITALRDKSNWIGGKPDAILISAGGNDIAGDQFCIFLDFNDGKATGLNDDRFSKALGAVEGCYLALFELRNRYAPGVPIYGHCYDFPIPNGVHPSCAGPWLKPSLDFCGWSVADGTRIAKQALTEFRTMLKRLEADKKNNFHVMETQGVLKPEDWANELHPGYLGFRKMTRIFYDKLTADLTPGVAATS